MPTCSRFPIVLGWILLLLAARVSVAAGSAAPKVVVSVLPVHSLAAALMRDVGEARLLMPAGQSPHGSQLRPSQLRLLEKADLIVWIGPRFERALAKSIERRRGAARIVGLMEAAEITLLARRRGGVWQWHEHTETGRHESHPDGPGDSPQNDLHKEDSHQASLQADPHLWLSTRNARAIVQILMRELISIDPPNRAQYQANARALLSKMARLRQDLRQRLRAVRQWNYVVFHDAYQYFEHEFALRPAGSLTVSPDRPPGARRMSQIREIIESRNIRCVFSEPQFPPGWVATLVADTAAAVGVLDPLGAALEPGQAAWFQLMRALADSLADCLR